jgi:hypothetical protein
MSTPTQALGTNTGCSAKKLRLEVVVRLGVIQAVDGKILRGEEALVEL